MNGARRVLDAAADRAARRLENVREANYVVGFLTAALVAEVLLTAARRLRRT